MVSQRTILWRRPQNSRNLSCNGNLLSKDTKHFRRGQPMQMRLRNAMLLLLVVSLAAVVTGKAINSNRLKARSQVAPTPSIQVNCPSGIVGQMYYCQLTISGITPPLTRCTLAAGTLPDGLSFVITGDKKDGCAIVGTPTTPTPIEIQDIPGNIVIKHA